MATTNEYALMAGASYISTRNDINQFPVPQEWTSVIDPPHFKDDVTGFEAIAFTNGTEIVISYAGTGTHFPDGSGDWAANFGLAFGTGSIQLNQAVDYYLQVKAAAPAGTKITLTGHSLGGGLAALVGVFFGVEAHTFDQAPFAQSARYFDNPTNVATSLRQYLHDGDLDILDVGSGESRRWRDEMPRSGYDAAAFAVYVLRLINRHGGCRYPPGIHLKTRGHAGKQFPSQRKASPASSPRRGHLTWRDTCQNNLAAKSALAGR